MININYNMINNLMKKHGTSFYLYDEKTIARQIKTLTEKFPRFEFLYSIKTNPFNPIVKFVASYGFGADAASSEEVAISQKAGLPYEKILYSTPGKTRKDIEKTIDKAIIIADSYNELLLVNDVARKLKKHISVGLRINPDFNMDGEGTLSSKFGVDQSTLYSNKNLISGLSNVKIAGIHVHLKSQVLDYKKLYNYYKNIFGLAEFCKEVLSWNIDFINFGGGLGIVYSDTDDLPLDIDKLSDKCNELVSEYASKLDTRLIIETGRYVICEAGCYVTPIVDIKNSAGIKYLIVEKGLNGFSRPSIAELLNNSTSETITKSLEPLYTAKDAFDFLIPNGEHTEERVSIVGSLCTATDIVAKDIMVPKAKIGDYLIITKAGSYSYSLSPLLFASHILPQQFYIKGDGIVLDR